MEIKALLRSPQATEATAVLLNDGGEEYPVFLKSLCNTVIFPALMESGYSLVSLPYGFVKDGVNVADMPVQVYQFTPEEEELMYASIGAQLPIEELRKHMKEEEVRELPTPPTNYTIFTRDEFLAYLDSADSLSVDFDYKPINYFVSPAARFSFDEFRSEKYANYVRILDDRRRMSYKKFHKLIAWLKQFGLKENYNIQDVLDAYFAWGVDGLNFKVINKARHADAFKIPLSAVHKVPVKVYTHGFIDAQKNLLTPPHMSQWRWELMSNDPTYLNEITSSLRGDSVAVQKFWSDARNEVTDLEGPTCTIRYNADGLVILHVPHPSLAVKSPAEVGSMVDPRLGLPTRSADLYDECVLNAMAAYILKLRSPSIKTSSYEALQASGLTPEKAIKYIIAKCGMNMGDPYAAAGPSKANVEDPDSIIDVRIEARTVDNFLNGVPAMDDEIKDHYQIIQDIIDGNINIDGIAQMLKMEAATSSKSTLYAELYAINKVMGMSFGEMYDVIQNGLDEGVATFHKNSMTYRIPVAKSEYLLSAYTQDIRMYSSAQARDCYFFTYVTTVAREVGTEDANRHVGCEFYLVKRKDKVVEEIIQMLEQKFEQRVLSTVSNAMEQSTLLASKEMFALNRFFSIVSTGTFQYPPKLGGDTETVTMDVVNNARSKVTTYIDSLPAICTLTADTDDISNLGFRYYCTNAFITPDRVIPKQNCKIHEVAFWAVWDDYSNDPAMWGRLVDAGIISQDFVSWGARYFNQQLLQRDIWKLDSADSLLSYSQNANQYLNSYPKDLEFKSVPHILETMYPALYRDPEAEDDYEGVAKLPIPREGKPVCRIGIHKTITYEDLCDVITPSAKIEQADVYIRKFTGFDIQAFLIRPNLLAELPDFGPSMLNVHQGSQTIFLTDVGEQVGITQVNDLISRGYPVWHVYDRTYLLWTGDGQCWEVRA